MLVSASRIEVLLKDNVIAFEFKSSSTQAWNGISLYINPLALRFCSIILQNLSGVSVNDHELSCPASFGRYLNILFFHDM